jgi:holo-[acyl-carrier protein] synthase
MVLGLGIDLVELGRIGEAYRRFGAAFVDRILLPPEAAYCQAQSNPIPSLAARFAAKEAVAKAFGEGIGESIGWHDIEVTRNEHGAPGIVLRGRGADLAESRGVRTIHLSLTHTATTAAAVAVLES